MAVEDLVDDFWREALSSNATGPEAEAKWNAFFLNLQARAIRFPKQAQDEVLWRAVARNAECIAIAKGDLDALRKKLGLPAQKKSWWR